MKLAGHGCPPSMVHRVGAAIATRTCRLAVVIALRLIVAASLTFVPISRSTSASGTESAANAPSDGWAFEARAVWGGGAIRRFAGTLSISKGSVEVVRNLSVQDDAVGTLRRISNSEIVIEPHSPSAFGGADLFIKGSADSELLFQWQDPNGGNVPEAIRIPISQLLHSRTIRPIDSRGSRLAIERQVHDRLRAQLNHGQSILSLGERCTLSVEGYANDLSAGQHRLNVRMLEEATNRVVATFQRDVEIDQFGCFDSQTFNDFTPPARAGVYCFEIGVQRRRLINSFINAIAVADRKLEFVVTDKQPPAAAETQWQELAQIYPAGASWWDSLGKFRVPSVKTLTPLVTHSARPLSSAEHKRRTVGKAECMVLAHGAWQVFPLTIDDTGVPHRLRIKVPADRPQKMAFSIQEPSPAMDSAGLRLDSGLIVEPNSVEDGKFVTHELLFWPKSEQPYLLVFNADVAKDAALAEIALDAAPAGLNRANAPQLESLKPKRLNSLYFDKPLLAENFGAVRRLDTKGQRELDSWQTCVESSTRLADYTAWSGFNAATITIATQGGAIYPSEILTPSAKFDSGTFLSDGSCPNIKDATELICREFDRRGLKLVLALDVEGMLAELEQDQAAGDTTSTLYQRDIDGNSARPQSKPTLISGTHYNPLDARVQTTLSRVLREVVERYGQHACFAGLQLNLSERSHFNFAGDRWGYDEVSLTRLERSLGVPLPADPEQRKQLLVGTLRPNFTGERAAQLSKFYVRLADELSKRRTDAKLLINPSRLLSAPPSADNFLTVESQALGATEVLLGCGIDCVALAANPQICVLRPDTDSPLRSPVARAWSYQLSGDAPLDAITTGKNPGAIIQQIPTGFRLPDFDKVNPLGNESSRTWLFPHASPGGDAARRALITRLFHSDALILASGGWLIPMGQEIAIRPLLEVIEELPSVSMHDVNVDGCSGTIRIRQTEFEGQSYFQFVNSASWQETVALQLKVPRQTQLHRLGKAGTSPQGLQPGEAHAVELQIPPYSLAGIRLETTDVKLLSMACTPEPHLAEKMERRLIELQSCIDRAGELNEQQTLGLRGADFESWGSDGSPEGWTVSSHPNTSVTEEHELPRSGSACVRLENRGNGAATAWIQSDRIAIPTTGRLALEVWARSAPGLAQPTVRMSLIGRYRDGRRFLRWHEFSSTNNEKTQIPVDWGRRPLVLLVPDVPNEDLIELYVAIDLIGPGRLWLDDVRVYGMYLHGEEKVHLLGQMFLAKEQMRKGDFTLADQLLESFWACFLLTYLTPPTTTEGTDISPVTSAQSSTRPSNSAPSWRSSSQPRFNQWQENLRQRWQR